jgi:hypothetical protein
MTLMMIQKPSSAVDESDLMALVQQGVEERETLDYKLEMYGNSDSEKREMLRDVSPGHRTMLGGKTVRYLPCSLTQHLEVPNHCIDGFLILKKQ